MRAVYSDKHRQHWPRHFLVAGTVRESPEVPARADALLAAVEAGGHEVVAPAAHGPGPIAAVHTPEYLGFLSTIFDRWSALEGSGPEVVPNVHPGRHGLDGGYPEAPAGQAGYHMADTACPISPGTWPAALAAADVAVHAAELVLGGQPVAYALCRPPGHHAFADMAGGFCFLNNTAIAAQHLRHAHERVAVLDVDVHHGNGTQGIFYGRADVLTVSLHADPAGFYPFFWGHAHERGSGAGLGYALNLPLPRGTGDDAYLEALDRALERIDRFDPGALVVALGLDAHEADPFAGLGVTTEGFARIAAAIARLDRPTVLVQEGGYMTEHLGPNLAHALAGFEGAVIR
jgi:acetoin utilization deacetylase AcuC-like enzyme